MKRKAISSYLSVLFVSSILLTSCMDTIELNNLDGSILIDESLVLPVGDVDVTMGDLINLYDPNGELLVKNDGIGDSIIYEYNDTCVFHFPTIDLTEKSVPSTKQFHISPLLYGTIPAGTDLPAVEVGDLSIKLNTNTADQRVDSARITNASFTFNISTNSLVGLSASDMVVTISFVDQRVKKASDYSEYKLVFTPTALNTDFQIDVADLVINTSGDLQDLKYTVSIKAKTGSSPVTVSAASYIQITTKISKLDFAVAFGYYKASTIGTSTMSSSINLAKYLPGGTIQITNPKIYVSAKSNIGAYLKFNVNSIDAYNTSDSSNTSIKASFNSSPSTSIDMNKKPTSYLAPNNTITTQLPRFDKDNGGTDQLYAGAVKPNKVNFKFSVQSDPTHINTTPDFITPDATIRVNVKTQIAFDLKAGSHYVLVDSMESVSKSIGSALDNDIIEEAVLVMKITNGLPLKLDSIELKFYDVNNLEIPTLARLYALKAPPEIGTDGIVLNPQNITPQNIYIKLRRDEVPLLKNTEKIVYRIPIKGENAKRIQITKANIFKIKLGIYVKGKGNVKAF